jgi:uncharacterized membrane protein
MDRKHEKLLSDYLKSIEARLDQLSPAARKELIAEIRSHLLEKWESCAEQNEENLLQVINEFGDPVEIAEDFLARSGVNARPAGPYPPTWLVLVLTVFLWPAGIILAWILPAWRLRDKIVATLIPVFIVLLLLVSTLALRYDFIKSESRTVELIQDGRPTEVYSDQ